MSDYPHNFSDFLDIKATNGYTIRLKSKSMSKDALTLVAKKSGVNMTMWEWMWRTGNIRSITRLMIDEVDNNGYSIKQD